MLLKFAVTNYRGFVERIEFNLSNHSNYNYNTFAVKNDVIKNGIIYGPNGSGKSNFALAIFDIVNHISHKRKKIDYYTNFVYAGNVSDFVKFEYLFKFDNEEVLYIYQKDAKGSLMSEELYVDNVKIFDRNLNVFFINNEAYPIDYNVVESLANNANNVSIVNYLLSSFPLFSDSYLIKLQSFVNSMLWFRCLENREFIGLESNVINLDEYIISNNLEGDFADFLSRVSSQSFQFVKPNVNDKVLYCKYDKGKIPFDMIASTGTQSLMLLFYWLQQMSNASFVFVDEFDAFYHFDLSYEVCKTLFGFDCQAFVSSHNTYLLSNELLRPDCNFIINNNVIKPLTDCTDKELRFGHNIEKMFRGGSFVL